MLLRLQKCFRVCVGSLRSSEFLKDPTRVQEHFGESEQHMSLLICIKAYATLTSNMNIGVPEDNNLSWLMPVTCPIEVQK